LAIRLFLAIGAAVLGFLAGVFGAFALGFHEPQHVFVPAVLLSATAAGLVDQVLMPRVDPVVRSQRLVFTGLSLAFMGAALAIYWRIVG